MIEHWYITVAAVKEWQAICGVDPPQNEGTIFDRCAAELDAICREARLKKDEGHRHIYEAKTLVRGKTVRLELYVSTTKRSEGDHPQLVRVRRKGGSRSGRE